MGTRLVARRGGKSRYRAAMASKKSVEKVQDLMRLASDSATAKEEARTAAMTAVRIMQEEGLTVVSAADLEEVRKRIHGAKLALKKARDGENQKLMMGAIGGLLASRFLRL
jgi:muramoyltetrapeptide carboxypeptidase LdcA involved in peptidoglycan recycling